MVNILERVSIRICTSLMCRTVSKPLEKMDIIGKKEKVTKAHGAHPAAQEHSHVVAEL